MAYGLKASSCDPFTDPSTTVSVFYAASQNEHSKIGQDLLVVHKDN